MATDRTEPYVSIPTNPWATDEQLLAEVEKITLELIQNAKYALSQRRRWGGAIADEIEIVDREPESYQALQVTIFREWLTEMFATGKATLIQRGGKLYMTLDTEFDMMEGLDLSSIQISNLRPIK